MVNFINTNLLFKISVSSLLFFSPVQYIIYTVLVLLLADLISGVWAALKKEEEIRSSKLRNSISKTFLYTLTICVTYMLQIHILDNMLPLTNLVSFYISTTEFYSLLENVKIITNNDILSSVMTYLTKFIKDKKL